MYHADGRLDYSLLHSLPEDLGNAISSSVEGFAREHGLDWDSWYYGLPIWIVREHRGARINKVQVDAVGRQDWLHTHRPWWPDGPNAFLLFTPYAYSDKRRNGMVLRKISSATEVKEQQREFPLWGFPAPPADTFGTIHRDNCWNPY